MVDSIPNLWPPEFKIDVQTPYAILQVQANLLGKVTRGILVGTVETEISEERVQHRLVVIAPAHNGYRHTLIAVWHDPDLPYPVYVEAGGLVDGFGQYPTASSDDQLQSLVKKALQSDATKAVILSLIAKSNEGKLACTSTSNGAGKPESQPVTNATE